MDKKLEDWVNSVTDENLDDLAERVAYGEVDINRDRRQLLPDNESAWTDMYCVSEIGGKYHTVCYTDNATFVAYKRGEACRKVEAHITRGHTDESPRAYTLPIDPPF